MRLMGRSFLPGAPRELAGEANRRAPWRNCVWVYVPRLVTALPACPSSLAMIFGRLRLHSREEARSSLERRRNLYRDVFRGGAVRPDPRGRVRRDVPDPLRHPWQATETAGRLPASDE